MAVAIEITDQYGTFYYINSSSSRDVLSWEQMKSNATYFYTYVISNYPNWTLNAVSAMLGNIQSEGAMNPSQWQYGLGMSPDGGFGLVQWTPATKYLDWCTSNGLTRWQMSSNIKRIAWEIENNQQYYPTSSYPLSFKDFVESNEDVEYLASAWLYNYERPKNPASTESTRRSQAKVWLDFLSGLDPDPKPPDPPEPPTPYPPLKKRSGMPFWMYPGWR